jgi:8-oxo-dGTP pyrophosphatase MutT (NUDIX family)
MPVMNEPASTAPKVIPASTVVIFRHCPQAGPPQLLMVQRAKEMRFAGGAAVFPGGRIDQADRTLAAAIFPAADPDTTAARIAGVRETLEETGLLIGVEQSVSAAQAVEARALLFETGELAPVLDRFGWTLDLDRLVPFARWCPMMDGAFDTRFFLADLGTGAVDVAVDATENTRLFWASAAEALRLADAGEIQVIFPTRRNLDRLALFSSFAEARAQAEAIPARMITPRAADRNGEPWLTIPEDLGYPVTGQPMSSVRRGL